jgi:hypothetical protein
MAACLNAGIGITKAEDVRSVQHDCVREPVYCSTMTIHDSFHASRKIGGGFNLLLMNLDRQQTLIWRKKRTRTNSYVLILIWIG